MSHNIEDIACICSHFIYSSGGEESSASEFIIGIPVNFVTNVILQLFVTTREPDPVPFTVETLHGTVSSGVATSTSTTVVHLDNSLQVLNNTDRNKGIRVYAGNKTIVVYGGSFNRSFTDTFMALPCTRQDTDYEYFAITYDENYDSPSQILLIGCEDDTVINTGSQTINLNKMETYLITSANDLTGTMVVSNKPLSYFSGHRCANVADISEECGYLIEQLPSTAHWGTHFLTASLAGQNNGDVYRILASKPSTTVTQYCSTQSSPTVHQLPSAGSWTMITNPDNSSCSFQSNNPLLMVQYVLHDYDPSMIIIPSIEQYGNNYLLNAFDEFSANFITIFAPTEYYQPEKIFVDDDNVAPWTTIGCGDNEVCGYAAFVELSVGDHRVYHTDMSARIGVIAYGFTQIATYGHVAGLQIARGIYIIIVCGKKVFLN